jgi:hypothetical protein
MSFPTLVYKSPGIQRKPTGGTYDFEGVETQEALDAKLKAGWFISSTEAIAAAGDKADGIKKPQRFADKIKKKKPSKPLDWQDKRAIQNIPVIEENAAPTRAELETKATELGIKFDGRTKDKKLGQLIEDSLAGE